METISNEDAPAILWLGRGWRSLDVDERLNWCDNAQRLLAAKDENGKRYTHRRIAALAGVSRSVVSERLAWSEAHLTGDPTKPDPTSRPNKSRVGAMQKQDLAAHITARDDAAQIAAELLQDPAVLKEVAPTIGKLYEEETAVRQAVAQAETRKAIKREDAKRRSTKRTSMDVVGDMGAVSLMVDALNQHGPVVVSMLRAGELPADVVDYLRSNWQRWSVELEDAWSGPSFDEGLAELMGEGRG